MGCFWPVDESDERVCDLTGTKASLGAHVCVHGGSAKGLPESEWRWCGSNFDALGNDRFGATDFRGSR